MSAPRHIPAPTPRRGFALVLSLTVMALLVLVILAAAGLVAVESRFALQSIRSAQARLNAAMALRQALGVLQQEMGPDQRVSAGATLLDANPDTLDPGDSVDGALPLRHPHWIGSWNSYRPGLGQVLAGPGPAPDRIGKAEATGADASPFAPSYQKAGLIAGQRTFRRWLVSGSPGGEGNAAPMAGEDGTASGALAAIRSAWTWNPELATDAPGRRLLGAGTLGLPSVSPTEYCAQVQAPSVALPDGAGNPLGRIAWWVTDNALRATAGLAPAPAPRNHWERTAQLMAPARMAPEVPPLTPGGAQPLALLSSAVRTTDGLGELGFDPARAARAGRFEDLAGALANPAGGWRAHWFDLTASSRGVLASVTDGLLRRDLSLMLENPLRVNAAESHIDLLTDTPPPCGHSVPTYGYWSAQIKSAAYLPLLVYGHRHPNATFVGHPWTDLWQWYQAQTGQAFPGYPGEAPIGVRNAGAETPVRRAPRPFGATHNAGDSMHQDTYGQLSYPRFARCQYIYSYTAAADGVAADGTARYRLNIAVNPVVTFWNPHNYRLEFPAPTATGPVYPSAKIGGQSIAFHVGIRRHNPTTNSWGAVTWLTRSAPGLPAPNDRWIHNSFFPEVIWLKMRTQSGPERLAMDPGEVRLFSLAEDATVTVSGTDIHRVGTPGWKPEFEITSTGAVLGKAGLPPLSTWTWHGGPRDKVVVRPYFSATNAYPETVKYNQTWYGADAHVGAWVINCNPPHSSVGPGEYRANNYAVLGQRVEQGLLRRVWDDGLAPERELAQCVGRNVPFATIVQALKTERGDLNGRFYPNLHFLSSSLLESARVLDAAREPDHAWLRNYGHEIAIEQLDGTFESLVQCDPDGRAFFGGGWEPQTGSKFVAGTEQPYWPVVSMGLLQNAQLGQEALGAPRLNQLRTDGAITAAFGNSVAFFGIPADRVASRTTTADRDIAGLAGAGTRFLLDHAYLANRELWDNWFLSTVARQDTPSFAAHGIPGRDLAQVLDDFRLGRTPLPQPRLSWWRGTGEPNDRAAWERLLTGIPYAEAGIPAGTGRNGDRCAARAEDVLARNLLLEGAFNVNSASKEAWKALLFSNRGKPVSYDGTSSGSPGRMLTETQANRTPFPRFAVPLGPCADTSAFPGEPERFWWTGYRALTDAQVDALADAIVQEVKRRGPFLSLAEFVNRRVAPRGAGTTEWFARQAGRTARSLADNRPESRGALQAAIDRTDINARWSATGRTYTLAELTTGDGPVLGSNLLSSPVFGNLPDDGSGRPLPRAYGAPGFLMQADVLNAIGAALAVRGDTFTVRVAGEGPRGEGVAYAEAVVQRLPSYVVTRSTGISVLGDQPETPWSELTHPANRALGRRMRVVSFRWLSPAEL